MHAGVGSVICLVFEDVEICSWHLTNLCSGDCLLYLGGACLPFRRSFLRFLFSGSSDVSEVAAAGLGMVDAEEDEGKEVEADADAEEGKDAGAVADAEALNSLPQL